MEFVHEWADEDIGQNCGRYEYSGGEQVGEYFPESDRERIEFAAGVLDEDPADWGLYLNASKNGYIYLEDEQYQLIELFGKPALFTNGRITDEDIPQGLHCYYLRESDDGGRLAAVEPKVTINHGGSVITDEPLDFGKNGYISLTEQTAPNFIGEELTIGQYMRGEFEQTEEKNQEFGGMQL